MKQIILYRYCKEKIDVDKLAGLKELKTTAFYVRLSVDTLAGCDLLLWSLGTSGLRQAQQTELSRYLYNVVEILNSYYHM